MYQKFFAVILNLSSTISAILAIAVSPTIAAQSLQVLPISVNSTGIGALPRPALPYHVQVGESDVSVQIMQYYALMDPYELCSCIVHALIEIYENAIYDHGNAPVRGDTYTIRLEGIVMDFQRYAMRRGPRLTYVAVVRTLQGVQIFTHQYGSYGMSLIIYELGVQVGHAVVRKI